MACRLEKNALVNKALLAPSAPPSLIGVSFVLTRSPEQVRQAMHRLISRSALRSKEAGAYLQQGFPTTASPFQQRPLQS